MLRGFHLTRDRGIPVAGVNLGRVGFLTTVLSDRLELGLEELLAGRYTEHTLLGLKARLGAVGVPGHQRRGHRQGRPLRCV